MKITNKIKFAAITLLLAGSATQAMAGDWVLGGMASGVYGLNTQSCLSYQTLAGVNTSWENKTTTYETNGYYGIINPGATATPNTNCISIAYYYLNKTIPSYSRLDLTICFYLTLNTTFNHNGCGLYLYDDEYTATHTGMDVTYQQLYDNDYHGFNYAIKKFWYNSKPLTQSATRSWAYDNKTGSTEKDTKKYVALVHSIGCGDQSNNSESWAEWKGFASESWTYYKYITFDANGGIGTAMALQTVVSNNQISSVTTLPKNTYTRTGCTFIGWNTQADGQGTAYAPGGNIAATSTDKGPVTLYAQWESVSVPVSESGSATIFSEKNVVVPVGVEVYGFTYSDGVLVQSEKISEGAILPANNGYLVKATKAGTYNFVTTTTAATAPKSVITGTTSEINTPAGAYVWGKPEGYNYGWYRYTGATIPAGKAYYIKQQ